MTNNVYLTPLVFWNCLSKNIWQEMLRILFLSLPLVEAPQFSSREPPPCQFLYTVPLGASEYILQLQGQCDSGPTYQNPAFPAKGAE